MGADEGKAQRQVTMKYQKKKIFLSFKKCKKKYDSSIGRKLVLMTPRRGQR